LQTYYTAFAHWNFTIPEKSIKKDKMDTSKKLAGSSNTASEKIVKANIWIIMQLIE
jgi:hypothetical protein